MRRYLGRDHEAQAYQGGDRVAVAASQVPGDGNDCTGETPAFESKEKEGGNGMNDREKEATWERLQERLPGGPGDPCLDCDIEDADEAYCRECRFWSKNRRGK